jgi:hypothetical protein
MLIYSYKTQIVLILASIALFINGCDSYSHELSSEDLVGTYVGYYDLFESHKTLPSRKGFYEGWTHKLELNIDATYKFMYTDTDGKEIRYSGKWEYPAFKDHDSPDWSKLVLNDLGIPYASSNVVGSWMPKVYKDNAGRIRIVVDGDRSFYLIKVTADLE